MRRLYTTRGEGGSTRTANASALSLATDDIETYIISSYYNTLANEMWFTDYDHVNDIAITYCAYCGDE